MNNAVSTVMVRVALGGALLGLVACSAAPREDGESASSALRTLDASEIKGAIQYGESRTLHYSQAAGAAKYVALSFEGASGDAIEVWARAPGGDARLWLTDAAFANVANNDDASTSTKDAHLVRTLSRSGTYYLVVRDANFEDADITLSLAKSNGPARCDPEEDDCSSELSGDPFDPSSCAGAPMTIAQARARFRPGTSSVALGTSHMVARERRCHDQTGCGPWTAATSAPFGRGQRCPHTNGWDVSSAAPTVVSVPASGTITLKAATARFDMNLGMRPFVLGEGGTISSSARTNESAEIHPFVTGVESSYGCTSVTMIGRDGTDAVAANAQFASVVTSSCLRASATGRVYDRKSDGRVDGSGAYTETQVVVYAKY